MSLAELQSRFVAALRDDEAGLPVTWGGRRQDGFAVYRNAYRARLVDALRETYPRTARLVDDESFGAAAAHHLILHPPGGWTLDDAGRGFAATAAELFPEDGDVAELAWIEWAMQQAFIARDAQALDGAGLASATASFDDADWSALRLGFTPDVAARKVQHDWPTLWPMLEDGGEVAVARTMSPLREAAGCVVWRERLRPVFTLVTLPEYEALALMMQGVSYGDACDHLVARVGEDEALALAGGMLGRWLANGWIEGLV